ncbi:MAG: hypothetical protein K2Y21_11005 [Phycisphaerales bacterium]|nr:hypothetical protein [Phycisphaerales bacterium]
MDTRCQRRKERMREQLADDQARNDREHPERDRGLLKKPKLKNACDERPGEDKGPNSKS